MDNTGTWYMYRIWHLSYMFILKITIYDMWYMYIEKYTKILKIMINILLLFLWIQTKIIYTKHY